MPHHFTNQTPGPSTTTVTGVSCGSAVHRARHLRGTNGSASVATTLLALAIASPAFAQDMLRTPKLVQLGKDQYKTIADVRERTSGDVLIADPEDASLWLVTEKGDRKNAATSGSPGAPGRMIALSDGVMFYSRSGSAFKVLKPDGTVSDASSQFAAPEGRVRLGATNDAYTADTQGQLYWLDNQVDPAGSPLKRRNASNQISNVATLRNPAMTTVRQGGVSFTRSLPFSALDDWAVDDSGTVAIARAEPYHIEVITRSGTTATGAARTIVPVPTMEEDKQSIARSRQKAMSAINLNGVSIGNVGGDDPLPPTKAPFTRGATRVAHNGTVLVHRAVAANSTVALIDVFGVDGNYRETLSLPKGARVVGFGARRTYVSVPVSVDGAVTLHTFDQ